MVTIMEQLFTYLLFAKLHHNHLTCYTPTKKCVGGWKTFHTEVEDQSSSVK